jgi:putative transposase
VETPAFTPGRKRRSAFDRFWHKQARYPRFKSRKKSRAAAEYTRSAFRYRDGQLHLAKVTGPLAVVAGIDAGITSLATLSTGEKIANPRHERRDRTRLARAQRRLSRKAQGSANRDKARLKVARVHARISDRRKDFLHKLTTRLVRDNQAVVIDQRRHQHPSGRAGRACLRSWRQTSTGAFPGGRPAVKQEPRRVTAGIPALGRGEVKE